MDMILYTHICIRDLASCIQSGTTVIYTMRLRIVDFVLQRF